MTMRSGSSTLSTTAELKGMNSVAPPGVFDLHHVARAEIVQRAHAAQGYRRRILDLKADEIGVVEFVRSGAGNAVRGTDNCRPFSASAALRSATPSKRTIASPGLAAASAVIAQRAGRRCRCSGP